jgi:LPXTG-motif cell wall-anchored protein
MDHSNRNRTPAELQEIEDTLRAERHQASPLQLDAIKLQAIRQAERPRTSLNAKKGIFMKSRLALTCLLVAGFMFSTTGATLAISGSSGNGSASESQYVSPTNEHGDHGVKGAEEKGSNKTLNGPNKGNGNGPSSGNQPVVVESAPAPVEQQAVVNSGSSLPFTGFVAIPLLIIGLAMIVGGGIVGLKSRKDPVARS